MVYGQRDPGGEVDQRPGLALEPDELVFLDPAILRVLSRVAIGEDLARLPVEEVGEIVLRGGGGPGIQNRPRFVLDGEGDPGHAGGRVADAHPGAGGLLLGVECEVARGPGRFLRPDGNHDRILLGIEGDAGIDPPRGVGDGDPILDRLDQGEDDPPAGVGGAGEGGAVEVGIPADAEEVVEPRPRPGGLEGRRGHGDVGERLPGVGLDDEPDGEGAGQGAAGGGRGRGRLFGSRQALPGEPGVVLAFHDIPDLVGVGCRGGDVPAGEGRNGFHLGRGLAHGSARGGGLPGGLGVPVGSSGDDPGAVVNLPDQAADRFRREVRGTDAPGGVHVLDMPVQDETILVPEADQAPGGTVTSTASAGNHVSGRVAVLERAPGSGLIVPDESADMLIPAHVPGGIAPGHC